MKVKTLKRFYDTKEKELRKPKDEFIASKERAEELMASPSPWVSEVKEDKQKSGE